VNQPPLNPDALAHARSATFDCWENGGNMDDLAECAIEAYRAVAQPVVDSVESIPAKIHLISWDGNHELEAELAPDETLVVLTVKTDRSWSLGDKAELSIYRPEVRDA